MVYTRIQSNVIQKNCNSTVEDPLRFFRVGRWRKFHCLDEWSLASVRVKRRKTERDDCKVERANRFRFIVRWSSTGGSRSAEKAAKGDGAMEGSIRWIELFKGRARTGAFYECPAQWRLCGPVRVAYTCCVHALTYIVGGRRHRHHRECANNEGKFVPRSH